MSGAAEEALEALVGTFRRVREGGREFRAMLVPVGFGRVGCVVEYQDTALHRAGQTAAAAITIRDLWHPTEVLWASDAYTRRVELGDDGVETTERREALALGYSRREGEGVAYAELPYELEGGKVAFDPEVGQWSDETLADPMGLAIRLTVLDQLPDSPVPLPPSPTSEQLVGLGITLATGAEYN